MTRKGNERRRGVSLSLSERVFRANRTIFVPVGSVQEANVPFGLPSNGSVTLEFDATTIHENWEPTWVQFDHINAAIESTMYSASQPYITLINDALSEVSKLEEQSARRRIQQQRSMPTGNPDTSKPTLLSDPQTKLSPGIQAEVVAATRQPIAESSEESMNQQPPPSKDYLPFNAHTRQIDAYEIEFERLKSEYDTFVQSRDPAIKQARLDIAKRIITTVNTLAGTQKQIDHSYSTLVNIRNQYGNDPMVLLFMTFRVVESVLDCCEPACQMYLNPKSVWGFAHLLRGLMAVNPNCREIYYSLIKKRSPYIIPRLHQSNDEERLKQLHQYSRNNNSTYFKRQVALVRLHLALMVVTQDTVGLWVWFAGFLNACSENVFKPPLSAVLMTALTIAAHKCLETYKEQFKKVLTNCENMFKRGVFRAKNCESADMYNEQLSHFFNEHRKTGTIKEPEGFTLKHQEEDLHKDI